MVPVVASSTVRTPTVASTLLSMFRIRIEAPIATTPPLIAPAIPVKVTRSSAITSMFRPAWMSAPEPMLADVPPEAAPPVASSTVVPPMLSLAITCAERIFIVVGLMSMSSVTPFKMLR